jgi:hypothetical protein
VDEVLLLELVELELVQDAQSEPEHAWHIVAVQYWQGQFCGMLRLQFDEFQPPELELEEELEAPLIVPDVAVSFTRSSIAPSSRLEIRSV